MRRHEILTVSEQIEEGIKNAILQGELKLGEKLPTEAELAEIYGVSRPTVRIALKSLEEKGILMARKGSKSLKKNKQYVLLPGKKKTDRPSTKTIMEILSFIVVVIVNGKRYFPHNCNEQALNMVRWAGYDPVDVCLKPLPWYPGRDK